MVASPFALQNGNYSNQMGAMANFREKSSPMFCLQNDLEGLRMYYFWRQTYAFPNYCPFGISIIFAVVGLGVLVSVCAFLLMYLLGIELQMWPAARTTMLCVEPDGVLATLCKIQSCSSLRDSLMRTAAARQSPDFHWDPKGVTLV